LEEAVHIFKESSRPSVVVINQLPPASPPSVAWHQDPELPAVGAAVSFLVFFLLVAGGCWWLRRYRPAKWETVKASGWRLLTWVALPLSWVCGRTAALLRYLHASAEGQHVASANPVQVSKTEYLYRFIV